MAKPLSEIHHNLLKLSEPINLTLLKTPYIPPEGTNISIKSILESLLPTNNKNSNSQKDIQTQTKDFCLCCALLVSTDAVQNITPLLSWIPKELTILAQQALSELPRIQFSELELGNDLGLKKLVMELIVEVLPELKGIMKESSIDYKDDGNEISAASARTPVVYAIVAAYQLRWFVTQVEYPHLGKLCSLVIPCALTALDHWSSEVKGQGMLCFIYLAKNVNAAEFGVYEDVILDICCKNIASTDELWHYVVEMSVLMVTCTQRKNPRSSWFEMMMNEMLSHLERQPSHKDRRNSWLELIEPVFNSMGIVLLAHFRRIFPLLFQWMHADEDRTVILVLERVQTIIKLTWIRNTPYIERLVDELTVTHKEAALRGAREEIRNQILQILVLLQKCKGTQFEAAWDKYKDDPNLGTLSSSLCKETAAVVAH
ncbi:hypothetical protein MKW94_024376 [Papaver nudicaule]|uniref:ARM repeat superfamily protein n=1 Tax=Papaver nudicaule TaxID=74823 RepID=A0AA41VL51_PAPNU|nr:hypothetical protein [Papaver nudicaule]